MMKFSFILIIGLLCFSFLKTEKQISNDFIVATYNYSRKDSVQSVNFYLTINLTLFDDYTFEENNENFQCFSNLADFTGTYKIKDSILVCTREHLLNVYSDTNKKGHKEKLFFPFQEPKEVKYLIKGDSLISLSDKSIRLSKH